MTNSSGNKQSRKGEIIIAIIGLIGVISTALISNWDKVSGQPQLAIQQIKQGYEPTGDLEIELRYLYEVTGTRKMIKNLKQMYYQKMMTEGLTQEEANEILAAFPDENKMIDVTINVMKKYMTLEEVQALNQFYSTEVMRNYQKKLPVMTSDMLNHMNF
jgi:hypothetical protein